MGQLALDELSARYVAGYFDAKGSVSIVEWQRAGTYDYAPSHILAVEIPSIRREPLALLHSFFGGYLAWKKYQQAWIYRLTHRQAEVFLKAIRPYILFKGSEIDIALAFRATYDHRERWLSDDTLKRRQILAARLSNTRP